MPVKDPSVTIDKEARLCVNCMHFEQHGKEFFGIPTYSCNARDEHLGPLGAAQQAVYMGLPNHATSCIYFTRKDFSKSD